MVLANVALLAYFNMDIIAPKPATVDKAIDPTKLKLLSVKELEAMPKKVVAAAPVTRLSLITNVTTCQTTTTISNV